MLSHEMKESQTKVYLRNLNLGVASCNSKNNVEARTRRRVTSSDTSDEHSADELLIATSGIMSRGRGDDDGKASSSSSDSCQSSNRSHSVNHTTANGASDLGGEHHAVGQWLQFLQMDQYLQGFIDNGYDDFETVKQIGPPDLEAIGVTDPHHQAFLQDAVRVLREQGAVWVYLLQEDSDLISDQFPDRVSAGGSSGIASGNSSSIPWTLSSSEADHDHEYGATSSSGAENSPRNRGSLSKLQHCKVELTPGHYPRPATATLSSSGRHQSINSSHSNQEDEDLIQKVSEMGIAQLVIERNGKMTMTPKTSKTSKREKRHNKANQEDHLTSLQLAILVKEKLHKECINLASAPFNSKAGDHYLAGLATRYASELGMDEINVLHQLDDIRQTLLSGNDVRQSMLSGNDVRQMLSSGNDIRQTMLTGNDTSNTKNNIFIPLSNHQETSQNSLISPGLPHTYANVNSPFLGNNDRTFSPGIYASSSCLSDKDEDDIYDLAAKYEGSKIFGEKARFFGSPSTVQKLKLSPSEWYTKARKAISKNHSQTLSKTEQDFSNFASSSLATSDFHIGSPTFMRTFLPTHTGANQRFSTRTRLRPGGPSHPSSDRQPSITRLNNGTTHRSGSSLSTFEEVGMRTLATDRNSRFSQHRINNELHRDTEEPFPPAYYAHTLYKGAGHNPMPTTPIVKQRTNCNTGSPRVQMYRTRVVYNDTKPPRVGAGIGVQEASV